MMEKVRIAVFASGKGSNLRAIYEAIAGGSLEHAEIVLIISNNSGAGALAFGREHDIATLHLSALKFGGDEQKFSEAMLEALRDERVDLIVLAGYLKKLPDAIVHAYAKRIVNIHPALLPKYGGAGMYGLNVHQAVLSAGDAVTGATVHYVDSEYDTGEIILQESCDVRPNDTPERLSRRVRDLEHRIYPQAIGIVVERLRAQRTT